MAVTYTVAGHSNPIARSRTHPAQSSPRSWWPVHEMAWTYPPTRKKTGMTWKARVTQPPQLT